MEERIRRIVKMLIFRTQMNVVSVMLEIDQTTEEDFISECNREVDKYTRLIMSEIEAWNRQGKIMSENMQEHGFECSECGFFDSWAIETMMKYCPNCGAKVRAC